MTIFQILILAVVQGLAELLPVSSSAHVITAERFMGLDPTHPEMTLLLVMLHTGTMFAVIVHFWASWRATYFSSRQAFRETVTYLVVATMATAVVGLSLQHVIKHYFAADASKFEIEHLFGNTRLMAAALASAGLMIIASSRIKQGQGNLTRRSSLLVGMVQGLCLPFRGFSRSGATISTALMCGVERTRAEQFSFALAVVLTPAVIVKEVYRLYQAKTALSVNQVHDITSLFAPSLLGMVFSFLAGLLALRWLSKWLETDRWHFFGGYCLLASAFVYWSGN